MDSPIIFQIGEITILALLMPVFHSVEKNG